MVPGGVTRPVITRVPVRVPTTVARVHAVAAARRTVGGLGVAGADVVDAERRLLAPAELELRIVDERLELHGEVPCSDAARALATGLRLLARELAGWQDALLQVDG